MRRSKALKLQATNEMKRNASPVVEFVLGAAMDLLANAGSMLRDFAFQTTMR
jgi:hypothetical protein